MKFRLYQRVLVKIPFQCVFAYRPHLTMKRVENFERASKSRDFSN